MGMILFRMDTKRFDIISFSGEVNPNLYIMIEYTSTMGMIEKIYAIKLNLRKYRSPQRLTSTTVGMNILKKTLRIYE